jgi:predicted unusual protein kinase regulating ubiquinone biosynthesis (AarF/ABC1/UbiB family)
VEDADMSYVFTALQDMLRRNGLRLDPNFTLVFKTLMQADEIIRRLEPDIALSQAAVQSSTMLLRQQANTDYIAEQVRKQVSRSSREIIYRMPNLVEATTKWLDQYEKGKLSVHVDVSDLSKEVTKLDKALGKALDRLVIGMILAGWLIGAAIVSTVNVQLGNIRLSDLAYYMFIVGTAIGIYVIFTSLRRQRREEDDDY